MAVRNCKHKERRLQESRKMMLEELPTAIVEGSMSIAAFENLNASDKESIGFLNQYLDEPMDTNYWRRKSYKPDKYSPPRRSDRSPKHLLRETSPKYHRCAKHGLVPLKVEDNLVQQLASETSPPRGLLTSEPTDSRTSVYGYGRKYDGVGINFLECVPKIIEWVKKLMEFCNKYPRVAMTIFSLLFLWWLSFQLETWMSHGAASLVRVGRPAAHWSSVSLEQFANRLRSFATSTDDLVEGFYCDFARSWCHRFEIMCDVRCSFMDKAIQRLRSA